MILLQLGFNQELPHAVGMAKKKKKELDEWVETTQSQCVSLLKEAALLLDNLRVPLGGSRDPKILSASSLF